MEIKKNWKLNDTVMPEDLNRIESNIEQLENSQPDENFSTADKLKLEKIEAGAQVNKIEVVKVNNSPVSVSNKAVNISVPAATVISNSLNNSSATEALSAAQGRILKQSIDAEVLARAEADQQIQTKINETMTLKRYTGDLNILHKAGFYSLSNCTHKPSNASNYATLIVSKTDGTTNDSATDTTQIYVDQKNNIYIRNCTDSSSWTEWKTASGGEEEYILNCYTTSGNITLPSDAIHNEIDVICIGGGGGGIGLGPPGKYSYYPNGGHGGIGGGVILGKVIIGKDRIAKIVIGSGGKGTSYEISHNQGGNTTFEYSGSRKILAKGDAYYHYNHATPDSDLAGICSVFDCTTELKKVEMPRESGKSIKYTPVTLPTKDIYTVNGGDYGKTAWGLGGNGATSENENGKDATEYGCGGGGGGFNKDRQKSATGGNGKHGCVYIGYWRKKK